MVVTSNTAGVTVPNGTTIVSITGNTATLSNNVTGSGTPTFSAIGPSDTADGGGIILKGSPSDHTFTWSNANDAWQSSEDIDLVCGKTYNIIDGGWKCTTGMSLDSNRTYCWNWCRFWSWKCCYQFFLLLLDFSCIISIW